MTTIRALSLVLLPMFVLLPMLGACPGETPCQDAFDCSVGERCLADGTCGVVVSPEPDPEPDPDVVIDAGPLDAGFDAGPLDAGPLDAGPRDAGPLDAGPLDAGPVDAGPLDAGVDAGPLDAGAIDAGFDAGPLPIRTIAGFHSHTCVLLLDGGVKCWGVNSSGQLGLGDTEHRGDDETVFPTVNLGVGRTAVSIAVGTLTVCAILDNGAVKCWGSNLGGGLGIGDIENRGDDETDFPAVNLGAGRTAIAIDSGFGFSCAILDNRAVKCWGSNSRGQLGIGSTENMGDDETDFATVNLGPGRSAMALATGSRHTCVILDNGTVTCWGTNASGQLGIGTTEDMGDDETDFQTVNLGAGRTAVAIDAGSSHTCVILDDGSVKCWGENFEGQLGVGDSNDRGDDEVLFPTVNLGVGRSAHSIGLGSFHTCAILDDGAVKCWGDNTVGALGIGDTENRGDDETEFAAVNLGTGLSAAVITGGDRNTCAILDNGGVKCWGRNTSGQLGLGDIQDRGVSANQMGNSLPFVSVE